MEEKPMTVDELINKLNEFKEDSDKYGIDPGKFNIKIGDNLLFGDEIGLNPMDKVVTVRGYLFHEDWYKKFKKFKNAIEDANFELLYGKEDK